MALKLKQNRQTVYMISNVPTTSAEAISHLFFHCCFKDGTVTADEINAVSEKLVAIGLNKQLNFKDEIIRYRSHREAEGNETAYIEKLVAAIQPKYPLALFSLCVELCISDGIQEMENQLLQKIGSALYLTEDEQIVCKKLMAQRNAIAREKSV